MNARLMQIPLQCREQQARTSAFSTAIPADGAAVAAAAAYYKRFMFLVLNIKQNQKVSSLKVEFSLSRSYFCN